MTSTSFNVGLGESSRNSSKVLKPPGGGSSDIFGSDVEQSPRRIRNTNHLKSSVFGSNGTSEPPSTPRNKLGNDSHNRLFGPIESGPQSASINRMKSSIPFGGADAGSDPEQSNSNDSSKSASPSSSVMDAVVENGQQEMLPTPRDGNPVTGEGYIAANGEKESSSLPAATNNATTTITTTTTNGSGSGSAEARRNRVPPGGYSSGLW